MKSSVFETFYIWLHTSSPQNLNADDEDIFGIIDLAIFCDTYQILALKNLTSDLIQKTLLTTSLEPLLEALPYIYKNTLDGAIVRELFALRFTTLHVNCSLVTPDTSQWIKVFEQHATFGRDYFIYTQIDAYKTLSLERGCRFHDHSHRDNWTRDIWFIPLHFESILSEEKKFDSSGTIETVPKSINQTFNAFVEKDGGEISHYQSISFMPSYQNYSPEVRLLINFNRMFYAKFSIGTTRR